MTTVWLSVKEVVARFNVSSPTVHNHIARGLLYAERRPHLTHVPGRASYYRKRRYVREKDVVVWNRKRLAGELRAPNTGYSRSQEALDMMDEYDLKPEAVALRLGLKPRLVQRAAQRRAKQRRASK